MSLLNQMLRDLEKRKNQSLPEATDHPSVQAVPAPRSSRWPWLAGCVVVALAALATQHYLSPGLLAAKPAGNSGTIAGTTQPPAPEPVPLAKTEPPPAPVAITPDPVATVAPDKLPAATLTQPAPATPAVSEVKPDSVSVGVTANASPVPVVVLPSPNEKAIRVTTRKSARLQKQSVVLNRAARRSEISIVERKPRRLKPKAVEPLQYPAAHRLAPRTVEPEAVVYETAEDNDSLREAEALYRQALNQDAGYVMIPSLEHALYLNPYHLNARLLLLRTLHSQGQTLKTARFLDESLRLFPDNKQFVNSRAQLYLQQKNPGAALQVLQRVNAAGRNNEVYLALLASSYQQLGAFERAREIYRELVEINPRQPEHWLGLAFVAEKTFDHATAKEAYQHALQLGTLKPAVVSYIKQKLAD